VVLFVKVKMYNPSINYTNDYLKNFTPTELLQLLKEAKELSNTVCTSKLIRKIVKDIARIRVLVEGFNSVYNGEYS